MTLARFAPALASICATVALSGCASLLVREPQADPQAIRAGAYALDEAHAAVLFKVTHLGLSTFVGRFERLEASLDFDETDPTGATLEAIIDMTSLDVANDDFAETLMGSGWFDAETYPQAVFRSTRIEKTSETTGKVHGDLTLRGVTKPMTLDVTFNGGARNLLTTRYTLGFSASGTIDRTEFGLDRVAGFVGSDVVLEIHAEFARQ